jgi:voltage-gated potassium channel
LIQKHKIRYAFAILFLIVVTGTVGYHLLEGWSILESFYATIVTLGTVGYGDYYPITLEGRLFAVFLIVFGVGAMAYTFALAMEYLLEGRLNQIFGRGKLERHIKKMNGHYIICGFGKMGCLICRELKRGGIDFVVIENDPAVIQEIVEEKFFYVKGSATEDKILIDAGVERAKGIVCALPTDAHNLYVILAAKEKNHDIFVLSRSGDDASERRLKKVGADRVMSPYKEGAMRMAMAILKPDMLDFIELTTQRQSLELRMEELTVCDSSAPVGKTLEESGLRQKYGLIVVAVKKESGKMIFNPAASYTIEKMDKLIALGEEKNLADFSEICQA